MHLFLNVRWQQLKGTFKRMAVCRRVSCGMDQSTQNPLWEDTGCVGPSGAWSDAAALSPLESAMQAMAEAQDSQINAEHKSKGSTDAVESPGDSVNLNSASGSSAPTTRDTLELHATPSDGDLGRLIGSNQLPDSPLCWTLEPIAVRNRCCREPHLDLSQRLTCCSATF